MGQKPSHQAEGVINKNLPFSLFPHRNQTKRNPNPEQPIKFHYKTKRKNKIQEVNFIKQNSVNGNNVQLEYSSESNQSGKNTEVKCDMVKTQNVPVKTKSEPYVVPEENRYKYRHRRKSTKYRDDWKGDVRHFGYDIQDVDAFLMEATMEKPANIPVVLAFPSVLYQTRIGGYQAEISLPLGMVVNAVFKNQQWLYVQTPHAEEGYVNYAACLPLGIIPPVDDDKHTQCWERSTDVFPKPSGNMTDTEKLCSKSDFDERIRCRKRTRKAASACGEKSFDRLYLRAAAIAKTKGLRQTLLVIVADFQDHGECKMSVKKGEVVSLLDATVKGWFYVKNKEGVEGYIPAAAAGHGFL